MSQLATKTVAKGSFLKIVYEWIVVVSSKLLKTQFLIFHNEGCKETILKLEMDFLKFLGSK